MTRIILASSSPRRKALLKQIGLSFSTEESNIKENPSRNSSAHSFARHLALRKAKAVAKRNPGKIVIAADTIVVDRGKILGKPASRSDAEKMLRRLSGRKHDVITGVAVIGRGKQAASICETKVWFRRLSPRFIKHYVQTGEPLDKAGAYGIQGMGALCVRKIEGDYFNVVGLPLIKLWRLLQKITRRELPSQG